MKPSPFAPFVPRHDSLVGKVAVALVMVGSGALAQSQTLFGACGVQDFSTINPQPDTPLVAGSLVDSRPRPGPDILYSPLATSPQLENTGPWNAQPIRISGATWAGRTIRIIS